MAIAYSDLHPEECTNINTETGVAAVCCADAVRTCDDGAPCHPKASLFTCEELGKLVMLAPSDRLQRIFLKTHRHRRLAREGVG